MKQKKEYNWRPRKLTMDDVKIVKQMLAEGKSQNVIAKKFNVSGSTIWKIKVGNTYNNKKPSSLFYLNY